MTLKQFNPHLNESSSKIQEEVPNLVSLIAKEKLIQVVGNKKDLYYFFDVEGNLNFFLCFLVKIAFR